MNRRSISRRSFLKIAGTTAASWLAAGCQDKPNTPSATSAVPVTSPTPQAASPDPTLQPTSSAELPLHLTAAPSPTPPPRPSATLQSTTSPTITATPSPLAPTPSAQPTPTPTPLDPATSVAIRQASSYDLKLIRQEVQAALDALGGIKDILIPGASVAIKPNLTGGTWATTLIDRPATESYVTHTAVVQAIGELLRDAGAGKIYIVEGVYDAQSFPLWGYETAAKAIGATLIDLNQPAPYNSFGNLAVGKGWQVYERFALNRLLSEVELFVSVPKLKCHWTCGVTLSMKNLVGIAPLNYYRVNPDDTYRSSLHGLDKAGKSRIPKVVIDLLLARPIQLSVIDGILTVDGGEGPWQKTSPQEAHVLIIGKNPLATDTVATAVMGFDPTAETPNAPFFQTYNHLTLAAKAGIGTNRLEEITVVGAPIDAVRRQFKPSQ